MLKIPKDIIEKIFVQVVEELPNEACGLLAGEGNIVKQYFPLTNIDHSPEHFSFDPKEQFSVLKKVRNEGWHIIANYHSHPLTSAHPSDEDIRLAYDPDIIYIIVSLANGKSDIKAFKIKNNKVESIETTII